MRKPFLQLHICFVLQWNQSFIKEPWIPVQIGEDKFTGERIFAFPQKEMTT